MPGICREKKVKCPDCGSESLRRSHRQDMERIFGWICPIAPFICKDCWRRFWVVKSPLQSTASKITAGVAVFLIALLVLTPHQDSRRSVSMVREGLSQDRGQSKSLFPNTYTAKISRHSDSSSLIITGHVMRPAGSVPVPASVVPALATSTTHSNGALVATKISGGTNEGRDRIYYSLQIGSYKNLAYGKKRAAELITEKGLHAWLRKVKILKKGEWFRVYVGKKKSRAEALNFGKKLKAERIIEDFSIHKIKETKPGTL